MSMEEAKRVAAELGLDEAPKLSPMESAYRMTPNYYVEQMRKRECENTEPDDGEGALLAREYGMNGQPPKPEERDLDVITEEIVFYKRQAGVSIIEIGKRLNEAKAQLEHGRWLDWLREKVDISERNAQNFMRLAREYSKSAEIADLGATKALALLALPESEREKFAAEKHVVNGTEKSVEDMTGEELKKAIRERDEAKARAENAEQSRAKMEADMQVLKSRMEAAETEKESAVAKESAKLDALKVKSDGLEEKLKALRKKEQEAKAEAENARAEKAELSKQLEELKKRPVEVAVEKPSQEELDKLRAEAETAAEEKVKDANARLMAAEAKADAADRAAEELRRQLAAADKDTQAFQFLYEEWQHKFNAMIGALQAVGDTNPEKAEKLKKAIHAAMERMGEMA